MAEESLLPSQQPSPNFAFKTKDFKRVFVIMSLFAFIQMGFDTCPSPSCRPRDSAAWS